MPLRVSVLVLPNVPWTEFLARCRHVEQLGFDALCFADHLTDWTGNQGPWFELWTQLSAVAMATTRIRLTTLVAQIPLRHPALLAQQAITADHISGGRLDLGLGTGLATDPSHRIIGTHNWTAKERVARFKEYVEILDQLLSNQQTTYRNRYYTIEDATLTPRPVQSPRPPILIAALGPVMLRHAARYADIWNSLSFAKTFQQQLSETRERIATLDAHCAAMKRDPATLRRSYLMFDPAARASGGAISYYDSEDAFTQQAEQLAGIGISDLVLYYPALDRQRPALERIARGAIPALRLTAGEPSP